jgi:hypothetical protein
LLGGREGLTKYRMQIERSKQYDKLEVENPVLIMEQK